MRQLVRVWCDTLEMLKIRCISILLNVIDVVCVYRCVYRLGVVFIYWDREQRE